MAASSPIKQAYGGSNERVMFADGCCCATQSEATTERKGWSDRCG